jgi:hypothetical protein
MSLAAFLDSDVSGLDAVAPPSPQGSQTERIKYALGIQGDCLPLVDDATLQTYYEHLSEHISFPFIVHYPEPSTPQQEALYECEVLELLDPSQHASDEFDGIFCKTRKSGFEVNLPLVDLEVREDCPNFQMIEDYWYWFWNWRVR